MKFIDYEAEAARTASGPSSDNIVNWAMGLAGETGELVDAIKKELFHDKPLSKEGFMSEAGDVLWYLTALCRSRGVSLERVAEWNLEKLRIRYPDGFVKGGGNRG